MSQEIREPDERETIELPAPTVWPMVLALGLTLLALGLATSLVYCVMGLVVFLVAIVGWVRDMLPGAEKEVFVLPPLSERPPPVRASLLPQPAAPPRALLPEKIYPYRAGLIGGFLGGVAMAVLALLYGVISWHGIWYPVNLLAGMLLPGYEHMSVPDLEKPHLTGIVVGLVIHAVCSGGMGLLYGIILPTLPGHRPLLWGGIIAPLLWMGGVYGFMGVVNPLLDEKVSWGWFAASQFAYGLVVGWWVKRTGRVPVAPERGGLGGGQT